MDFRSTPRSRLVLILITVATLLSLSVSLLARSNDSSEPFYHLKARSLPNKPAGVEISDAAQVSHVVVKFTDPAEVRFKNGRLFSRKGLSVAAAEQVLGSYYSTSFKRLLGSQSEAKLDRSREVLQYRSQHELADLNSYYRVEVSSTGEAEQIINQLNTLDIVELAYFMPAPEPAGDIDPPTPNYAWQQDYRTAAPNGVDADYANTLPGGDGSGVMIIDIEGAWQTTHEDLDKAVGGLLGGEMYDNIDWRNHGTAVIGEMIAGDNGYGVTGICPGADIGMVSIGGISTTEALYTAVDNLEPGDLILIELHAPGPHYNFESRDDQNGYVCMEYWQANFDAIQYAWAKGIIVVEAAGNGGEDYDDFGLYGSMFDTTYRNSHAIIVGAGYPSTSPSHLSKHGFSNYGERVNLQGYGSGVYTTGYGNLFTGGGDENQYYTYSFSGTSSASPIVTGAAACLQGYYKANHGASMTSDMVRDLLVATGTPQTGNTSLHIGPLPNLQAAFNNLYGLPSLYADPMALEMAIADDIIADTQFYLINRGLIDPIYYELVGNDSLTKFVTEDWLLAGPESGTVPPADSVLISVAFDATNLEQRAELYRGVVEISWGHTPGLLDSLTLVPAFLEVPCADESYAVSATGDPGGPAFGWISAKDLGTRISSGTYYGSGAALDDGTTGPHTIGFDFPFYETFYNQMYIGVNGALSFTDTDINIGGFFGGVEIPGTPFTTFVSPFWADLIIDNSQVPDAGIYLYTVPTGDTTVIEWYRLANFNMVGDTLTDFEIVLTSRGDVLFQYNSVGTSGLEQNAVVGISELGCKAAKYFGGGEPVEHAPFDSEAVLFFNNYGLVMAGNVDGTGPINIADLVYFVNYMFNEGPPPVTEQSGDVDCSGRIDIADLVYLVNYSFDSGDTPCYYWPF